MTGKHIEVSGLGTAFLPGKFGDACEDNPVRRFEAEDGNRNQAMKFLKRGGAVVLTGAWADVRALQQEMLKHSDELLPNAILSVSKNDRRERVLATRHLRQRVLATLEGAPIVDGVVTSTELPGFLGETSLPDDMPILLPVQEAERLLTIPQSECFVRSIDAGVIAHPDVLVPQSQETIDLVCEAIRSCEPHLPSSPKVLEIGCGSGVLCVASWQILQHKQPIITASDILPEAAATAAMNWRRLSAIGKAGPESALTTRVGSLFDSVPGERFDLIIFNAPWVVAPARTRLELALNDEGQNTIRGFVMGSPAHLSPGGRVIVGYADNSGPKAMTRLEESFAAAGLVIEQVYKNRIHTHRAKRQWQSVFAYVLDVGEAVTSARHCDK